MSTAPPKSYAMLVALQALQVAAMKMMGEVLEITLDRRAHNALRAELPRAMPGHRVAPEGEPIALYAPSGSYTRVLSSQAHGAGQIERGVEGKFTGDPKENVIKDEGPRRNPWTCARVRCLDCGAEWSVGDELCSRDVNRDATAKTRMLMITVPAVCPKCRNLRIV